jgi:hypothetical protein
MQQKSIVAHNNYLTPQATHRKTVFLGGMRLPRYILLTMVYRLPSMN